MSANDDVPTETSPGPCVRCGRAATRSCFLFSARSHGGAVPGGIIDGEAGMPIEERDIEAELIRVCETCIDQVLQRRRHIGIAAAGILLFLGLLLFIGTYDEMRVVALAIGCAGLIWGVWTLLDTHDARDEVALRIAKDEAMTPGSRRLWTAEEFESTFGHKPGAPHLRIADRT